MNLKPLSSPLPEAFLPLDMYGVPRIEKIASLW